MKRRTFIAGLGGAAVLADCCAVGRSPTRVDFRACCPPADEWLTMAARLPPLGPFGPLVGAQGGRWRPKGARGAMSSRPEGCCLSSRDGFHKSALSAKYDGLPPRGIATRLEAVSERLTLHTSSRYTHHQDQGLALIRGRVVTEVSGDEMVVLFKEHLTFLRKGREAVLAHITASREMIERSSALIVQIDEQINRMEGEIGWVGGHARRGPEPETVI
jgi:hypothetical protein